MRRAAVLLSVTLCALRLTAQAPLEQRVSLSVRDAPLVEALMRLRQGGIALAWSGDQIPMGRRVTLTRRDTPLSTVLAELLSGTGLTPVVASEGSIVLVAGTPRRTGEFDAPLLASGIQALDQLIVTGTAVGRSPEREQPTSVTVVTREDLAAAPHHRLTDAMRAFLPGLVLWDRGGAGLVAQVAAVRGVASFTSRAPKIYVDGIEVASPSLFTLVDSRSVERIELINGPQGAALYGPDALNGVLQIETRKGRIDGPTVPRGSMVIGGHGRDADVTRLWWEGAGGVSAATPTTSFDLLGSVHRLGTDITLAESWRLHAGGQYVRDKVAITGSVRGARHTAPLELVGTSQGTMAAREVPPLEEAGGGITVTHSLSPRLSHALTAGVHHISGAREPFRSPILPSSLPLGTTSEDATRSSARWAGRYQGDIVSLSVGLEASRHRHERSGRRDGTGDISALYQEALTAIGTFAQGRLRLGPVMVSGGGRVDHLSSVGVDAEVPWAATVGASWTVPMGLTTLRLRAAWGSALRPPEPGMSRELAAGTIHQDANPVLAAERQYGVEFGAEAHFASGAWLRATWFDQRANDLIQQVDLRRPIGTTHFYQFQNVGAITNRGLEFDGGVSFGRFVTAARVHIVDSRVTELSPTYSGDFEAGDHPLEVPEMMGSVALRYDAGRVTLEAGATWLGNWTGYDWQLIRRVEQGLAAQRDRAREYWLQYGGVVRPFVGIQASLTSALSGWVRAEWPAGTAILRDNLSPPAARTLLLGVELN